MKDYVAWLVSCLIFPVAPIAVIFGIFILCADIWQTTYYTPAHDGGEVEPAIALLIIPLLLIIASVLLCAITAIKRRVERRYAPGNWWRLLMGVSRVLLVAVALLLFLLSAGFFMGDLTGFEHWQVVGAWLLIAAAVVPFITQQYRRLVE